MKNDITAFELPKYCKATSTHLTFAENTPFEAWEAVGTSLRQIDGAVQLWLGDWLNFGQRAYGEKYTQAMEGGNYELHTLQNYASIAGRTELARQVPPGGNLSMHHWDAIAGLDQKEQVVFAKKAADKDWTVKELREAIRDKRRVKDPKMPEGEFDVILCDPPWSYNDKQDIPELGGAQKHYPSMSIQELCDMRVPAAEDAVLFLWVTSPLLEASFEVIRSWGFEYKTSFVWDKVKHNMGHYNSVRHEFLLVCVRGSKTPEVKKLFDSVITEERSNEHSEKPMVVYKIIETLYPRGKYLELFGRKKRKGWTIYGNEL
jgi:N6-adenosine-specific RNA methylase IME4